MKILVLAKHVPDTEVIIKISSDGKSIDDSEFKYIINPCDEYAIETAIRTQEKFKGESVVISVGLAHAQETIRKALAMGIDKGIWINTETYKGVLDSFSIAQVIAKIVNEEKPDVIFAGLNTLDEGAGNVAPMLAELTNMSSLINVSKLEWINNGMGLVAEREVENGIIEVYETKTPVLIVPHSGLNEPRYPSLPGIMKAKKKPLSERNIHDLITEVHRVEIISYHPSPVKAPVKIFKNNDIEAMVIEVVKLLRTEVKVI